MTKDDEDEFIAARKDLTEWSILRGGKMQPVYPTFRVRRTNEPRSGSSSVITLRLNNNSRVTAGYAVAALHYAVPFVTVSIEEFRLVSHHPTPATLIVALCGPLAEFPWREYNALKKMRVVEYVGTESANSQQHVIRFRACRYDGSARTGKFTFDGTAAVLWQGADEETRAAYVHEALFMFQQRPWQRQIDLVARALLERHTLSKDEVRKVSWFRRRIRVTARQQRECVALRLRRRAWTEDGPVS
jgi:hypothetical protein